MNILLVGQGSVLSACAEFLRAKGTVFSVLEPKEAFSISFAGPRIAALGIPFRTVSGGALMEYIQSAPKPLLIFSIVNKVLFPADITEREDITIINYHNALLPGHRGRNCEAWQIYHQESCAGVTWHYVDSGVDTGGAICQSSILLSPDVTSIRLLAMQAREAVGLFRAALPELMAAGTQREVPPFPPCITRGKSPTTASSIRRGRRARHGLFCAPWITAACTPWAFPYSNGTGSATHGAVMPEKAYCKGMRRRVYA